MKEALSSTDRLVASYQEAFVQLREEYTSRIATQTALVTANIATTTNEISESDPTVIALSKHCN